MSTSAYYEMTLQLETENNDDLIIARKVFRKHWILENEYYIEQNCTYNLSGKSFLHDMDPDDFGQLLADEIWKEANYYIPILLDATYLEQLPHEEWVYDKENYHISTGKFAKKED